MGGYACKRTSKYYGRDVRGELKLPSAWAGVCPGDAGGDTNKNIVPEIFFGMYNGSITGFDAGIRMTHGGSWRPFMYGYGFADNNIDGPAFPKSAMQPGMTLRMKCWIEKVGDAYYAKLNVTKSTNYDATDLMSQPFTRQLSSGTIFNQGGEINREITIAANPQEYEQSGCYSLDGAWLSSMYTTSDGKTYIWTDANSKIVTENGRQKGASGAYVLELRKDEHPTYDANRIKLVSVSNNPYGGASESVRIDFRPTPGI